MPAAPLPTILRAVGIRSISQQWRCKYVQVGGMNTDTTFSGKLGITGGGSVALTKVGTGKLTLTGASTNTGPTTVTLGTLAIGVNNALSVSSAVKLNGGTLATGTFSEAASTLTLLDNSAIDLGLGTATSKLSFADSSALAWTASKTLTVKNWDGLLAGGGTEWLKVGSTASGLTVSQLSEVQFLNPLGLAAGTYQAQILSTGEVVPLVPEPSTIVLLGMSVLGLLAYAWRKRK